jgi:hypothetical protein
MQLVTHQRNVAPHHRGLKLLAQFRDGVERSTHGTEHATTAAATRAALTSAHPSASAATLAATTLLTAIASTATLIGSTTLRSLGAGCRRCVLREHHAAEEGGNESDERIWRHGFGNGHG